MNTIPNINEILAQQNLNKKGPPLSQAEIQNKIAALTQTINSKVLCGPDCQQNKNSEKLQQKYMTAKENVKTAPDKYNIAEKNYFTFVNGETWWKDHKREKINKNTEIELSKQNNNFIKKYEEVEKDVKYYKSQYLYLNSLDEILDDLENKNSVYKKDSSDHEKKVQTSYRRTTYYKRDINDIISYKSVITYFYYFLVIGLAITLLFFEGEFKNIKVWGIIIGFLSLPYLINPVFIPIQKLISSLFNSIFTNLGLLNKRIIAE